VPKSCWKLQRWLQIGEEKKLSIAWKVLDQFPNQCISSKREELSQKMEEANFDLLAAFIEVEPDEEEKGMVLQNPTTL
jgi:hypothetical protein